jgi:ADP-ribose pyrophosphatase YjhB (NUDIX family)
MKLLAEITEASLGLSDNQELIGSEYRLRKSARAILLNTEGKMAVQYLKTHKYHKLPGGGIEIGETTKEALKREIKEEVGCDCKIIRPVGMTIEYLNKKKVLQISYCYVAEVVGEIGEVSLEEGEVEEGQETLRLLPNDVLSNLSSDIEVNNIATFILNREKSFLGEYLSFSI